MITFLRILSYVDRRAAHRVRRGIVFGRSEPARQSGNPDSGQAIEEGKDFPGFRSNAQADFPSLVSLLHQPGER